jgi:hypothetical protein
MESICGTTGSDSRRELQITNGVAIRWRENKVEGKRGGRKRKRGPTLFYAEVMAINMVWLMHESCAPTDMAWLLWRVTAPASVAHQARGSPPSRVSAHGMTPSLVTPTVLAWLKRARSKKIFCLGSFLKIWLKKNKMVKNAQWDFEHLAALRLDPTQSFSWGYAIWIEDGYREPRWANFRNIWTQIYI